MSLVERIGADIAESMKARDAARTSTLRLAKSALKNKEIDQKAPLDDAAAAAVLRSLVKQREDAAGQYRAAARADLAEKEEAEVVILRGYLPAEAGDAEIEQAVADAVGETGATSVKDMGKVMKAALARLAALGKPADGKKVSEAVKRRLSA